MDQTYDPNPLAEGRSRAGRAGRLFALLILSSSSFRPLPPFSAAKVRRYALRITAMKALLFPGKLRLLPSTLSLFLQEAAAADLIWQDLRVTVTSRKKQTFSITDEEGGRPTSANIVARLGARASDRPEAG